jgi:signal transduction histidine kinase/streptogramin lyase
MGGLPMVSKFSMLLIWLLLSLLGGAEQLPIRIYRTADGLARDSIYAIVTDKNGYLWFATGEGLSRFDGYEFTNYGLNEGLPDAMVNALLIARDGSLWVGTQKGLCHFNPESRSPARQRFTVYQPSALKDARNIRALAEDRDGSIWCGTWEGVFCLRRSHARMHFEPSDFGEPKPGIVNALQVDSQGALWVGAQYGLYRRGLEGETQRYTTLNGLTGNSVHAMFQDRRGRMWVGSSHALSMIAPRLDPHGRIVGVVYPLVERRITAGIQTTDGRFWLTSSSGLSQAVPGNTAGEINGFLHYGIANGLSDLSVNTVCEDRAGNLWLGSDTGGAMKIASHGIVNYTEADGLASTRVRSLSENRAGEFFAISASNGSPEAFLQGFDGERFRAIPLGPLGWNWNQIGFEDHTGEWWVAADRNGLRRFRRVARLEQLRGISPKSSYSLRDGLGEYVSRAFEDSKGDIWISSGDGKGQNELSLWQRSNGAFRHFSEQHGFVNGSVATAFREDHNGALWIGFWNGGLARYRDGRFMFLGPDSETRVGIIKDIFADHKGRLWIATSHGGLLCMDDPALEHPRVVAMTTAEGLSSNETECVTEDLYRRLYVGTGRGLDRLNPDGLIEHFTTADGFAPGEPVVAFRDRQGALWFGNLQGLSRWLPEPPQRDPPPPILIRGVRVRGITQPISELGEIAVPPFVLASSHNQLQFDFVSINFRPAEKRRYQYKLENADTDWRRTESRSVNYASLPPGTYRFLVRAMNSAGALSLSPATASFTILPPYWQRWWFELLALLTCGSLLYAAHRYNVNRALQLERVRTRIATDLHDDIGSSLSGIAFLSEAVRQEMGSARPEASEMASEAAVMARSLARALNDVVWSIDPRRDDLHNLITRVRQSAAPLEAQGIAWSLRAPPEPEKVKLTPEQRHHLYLIFKEALNNIARHAHCRSATLTIAVEDRQLRAEIVDDGCGFSPPTDLGLGQEEQQGNGLRNMKLRAAQLGGQLCVESVVGFGARLKLTVPLK